VTGSVNKAGVFPHEQGLNVENAIALAGGVRHSCLTNRFTVIRTQDGGAVRFAASAGTVLERGDTLDVMEVNDGESRCK
jgi:protein involved in polysaccharide export with SLBB domain